MNQLSGHELCTQEPDTGDIRQRCMSRLVEHEPWMHVSDNGHISCGCMPSELAEHEPQMHEPDTGHISHGYMSSFDENEPRMLEPDSGHVSHGCTCKLTEHGP